MADYDRVGIPVDIHETTPPGNKTIQVNTAKTSYSGDLTINRTEYDPEAIFLTNNVIHDEWGVGESIATIYAIDQNPGDIHDFNIINDPSGIFGIEDNQLIIADDTNLVHRLLPYIIRIEAVDPVTSNTHEEDVPIYVTDATVTNEELIITPSVIPANVPRQNVNFRVKSAGKYEPYSDAKETFSGGGPYDTSDYEGDVELVQAYSENNAAFFNDGTFVRKPFTNPVSTFIGASFWYFASPEQKGFAVNIKSSDPSSWIYENTLNLYFAESNGLFVYIADETKTKLKATNHIIPTIGGWYHCFVYLDTTEGSNPLPRVFVNGSERQINNTPLFEDAFDNICQPDEILIGNNYDYEISNPLGTDNNLVISDLAFSTQSEFKNYINIYRGLTEKKRLFNYPCVTMTERFTRGSRPGDLYEWEWGEYHPIGGSWYQGIVGDGFDSRGYGYIDFTSKMPPLAGKKYLAISFWFKISSSQYSNWERLIWLNQSNLGTTKGIVDAYWSNDRIEIYSYEDSGSYNKRVFSNTTINKEEWYHFFLEINYDDNTNGVLRFYLNGSIQTYNRWTSSSLTEFPYNVDQAYLLAHNEGSGLRSPLDAQICDLHISTDYRVSTARTSSSFNGQLPSVEL